jgi:hypothetical protein
MKAVHDDDLIALLKSLQCFDVIETKRAQCHFCGKTITLNNIEAVFPKDSEVCFCCGHIHCYEELIKLKNA